MITDNTSARFDVEVTYRDGRDPQQHTNVSAQVADDLEFAFNTDPGVSQVSVIPRNADAAPHGDPDDEAIRLTADVVLFGDFPGGRHVLLIERAWPPFKGRRALPGGHVGRAEETEAAAARELAEETGISVGSLTYVGAYGAPGRDPRGRYVTFAYAARMPHRIEPTAGDDADRAEWVPLDRVLTGAAPLAFDHARIIRDALSVARFFHS